MSESDHESHEVPGHEVSSADVIETLADRLSKNQVFGTPVQQGKTTLVPVAHARAGGGLGGRPRGRGEQINGGVGFVARPVGAWAIGENGSVVWHPAVNVNRIVWGGQLALAATIVAVTALVTRRRCGTPQGGRRLCRSR